MKFNQFCAALVSAAALLVLQPAQANLMTEVTDAGNTAATAQAVAANTTEIRGNLGGSDAADIFSFNWAGGVFTADTYGSEEMNPIDTMLGVYNSAGTLITFNDDYPNCCDSFVSVALAAGSYFLTINECCSNYAGTIAGFSTLGSAYNASYVIHTSNISGTQVPEPTTLVLLFLGLASLGFARARKA